MPRFAGTGSELGQRDQISKLCRVEVLNVHTDRVTAAAFNDYYTYLASPFLSISNFRVGSEKLCLKISLHLAFVFLSPDHLSLSLFSSFVESRGGYKP